MKNRLFLSILLLFVAVSVMSQTVGETMFIYRNNGQIIGFLPDEVESIEYSYEDADGNHYDEIVTQIVNTADSVYMIPLAQIDSVSFVKPKTVYKPGVINLSDQLMPYVVSSSQEPLTITFSSSTPNGIMPCVGDKLVAMEMNEKFPAGFAGEVVSISGLMVTCRQISLEDVFETFYNVSSTYGYQEGGNIRRYVPMRGIDSYGNKDFRLGTWSWSNSSELGKNLFGSDLALKFSTQSSIDITPSFHVISTLIVNKEEGTYFNVCITGDITVQEQIAFSGGLEWSSDFLANEWVRQPVAPFVFFYVKPGLFLKASLVASLTSTWTQCFTTAAAFDFSTKKRNVIKPTCGGRLASSSFDVEGAIDGTLAAGLFVELGVTVLSSDIDKVCLRGEMGAELVGHAVLYNSEIEEAGKDTKVYERFKNSNIAVNAFVTTAVQAELGPLGVSASLPWNLSKNLKTWDVVPTFSNTTFKQCLSPQTSADASVDMSGNCLLPVEVGLSVRDKDGAEVAEHYATTKFHNGNIHFPYTFTDLSANGDYTLYPKVRILGIDMLASPSSKMEHREFPVEITEFKQTDAEYMKDGFMYNGETYSFKFDCTVTVTLKDATDVEDWGYVYRDPNGEEAYISLKSFPSPYSDSRYVYYRNNSHGSVKLFPYVKLYNEEISTGKLNYYNLSYNNPTCPDGNHPHFIDLGLPSGTKWACCNKEAKTGESYTFYEAPNAPTIEQFLELISYANTYQVEQVDGFLIIGKGNDGLSIFIPFGRYWTSSSYSYDNFTSYGHFFVQHSGNGFSGFGSYYLSDPDEKLLVRPVQ
ncbi:MAG: hypothetical protein IKZ48_01720 [Prevotella sp.]|nr:hypothetical protein [Prevotella sp.]